MYVAYLLHSSTYFSREQNDQDFEKVAETLSLAYLDLNDFYLKLKYSILLLIQILFFDFL